MNKKEKEFWKKFDEAPEDIQQIVAHAISAPEFRDELLKLLRAEREKDVEGNRCKRQPGEDRLEEG